MPVDASVALRGGTQFKLLSLDTNYFDRKQRPSVFHNFNVLGATSVSPTDQAKLVDALIASVLENDGATGACFNPRHGIRTKDRAGKKCTMGIRARREHLGKKCPSYGNYFPLDPKCNDKRFDFVICFECLQIYWYVDDEKNPMILTSGSPLDLFNDVLTAASIPIADPA
ncbi:hypothetical protein Poly51_44260 [Rubripirellula tenax]|uniref:Uncharacterized protein n=1 Tax=Rubripirellula tenax TaxID=2528015 RepID=A0A5C6ELM9_9BACT|nr:hypothetical protein [Rubripirellula tenax]TWU48526.1 hypothetical protein Poly51_44260 [Rubripirellula tenax]